MGIFSRKSKAGPTLGVPAAEPARLSDVGRAVYLGGPRPDVSGFYLPAFLAAGSPPTGSPEFAAFSERFLTDLLTSAESAGGWACPGAMYVAKDFYGDGMEWPAFVEIVDLALPVLAANGVSGGVIPMFLMERWGRIQRDQG